EASDPDAHYDLMDIDNDLLGLLWTYHKNHEDDPYDFESKKEDVREDTKEWKSWKKDAPGGASKGTKKGGAKSGRGGRPSPKKPKGRAARPKAASSRR
ncbi:MAG: hypothetical protein ACRCZI_01670, partial [Cetobacterium sp.]